MVSGQFVYNEDWKQNWIVNTAHAYRLQKQSLLTI